MSMLDPTAALMCADARAFVLLKSRRRLDLLNPDPQAWTDGDLAAGLSRTMRWGGASQWGHPLSVAQHSLTVLAIREGEGPLTAQEGLRELLHDATEFIKIDIRSRMGEWSKFRVVFHAWLGLHRASEGATRRAISPSSPAGRHRRALSAAAMDRGGLREAQAGRSCRCRL